MKALIPAPLALAVLFASASTTAATVLTSPVVASSNVAQIHCTATNVGTSPITVTISPVDTTSSGGTPTGPTDWTIPPGGTVVQGTAVSGNDQRYCVFSGAFSAKKVRAQIELRQSNLVTLSLPAVK